MPVFHGQLRPEEVGYLIYLPEYPDFPIIILRGQSVTFAVSPKGTVTMTRDVEASRGQAS